MGFFGKLFEKKECAICGGEIGLLGNRKLEDGNMCKNCASRLSPWFSDRRHSTIAEIEEQLAYRDRNREALHSFRPGRRIGENYKLIAEERGGVPYRFVVSSGDDFAEENADIVLFSDVSSCNIDIDEYRTELKRRNSNDEMVSYNPPRYEYSFNFYVKLTIENNPYFDEMRFKLNNFSVDVRDEGMANVPVDGGAAGGLAGIGRMLFGNRSWDPHMDPKYRKYEQMCDEIRELMDAGRRGAASVQASAPVQEAPRPKFCPNCGAPAEGGKFCQHCGSKL